MSKACLIIIGNEILSGRTQDLNLAFLGVRLNKVGIRLAEARVISDDTEIIINTLNECRSKFDYVFTTGGIGPTHDDITSAAVAKAFGLPLIRDPEALAQLRQHYANPKDLNEQRMKMCEVPKGAKLVDNPISKAPGYQIENVFVLAGVPRIMQAMYEALKGRLIPGSPIKSRTVVAFIGEGTLAKGLGDVQNAHSEIEIGSYPFIRDGKLGTALVLRGEDQKALAEATEAVTHLVSSFNVEHFEESSV
jgi:molybdenum cofactor synthesis domain-containing protein